MDTILKRFFVVCTIGIFSACTVSNTPYDYLGQGSTGDPNNPYAGDPNNPYPGDPNNPYAGDPNNPYAGDPNNPYAGDPNNPYAGDPNNPYAGDPNNPPPNVPASQRALDFPYELIPDTLTALTCPQAQYINNRHFTLFAGAYTSHGLQLSRDFLESNDITEDTPYQRVRQLLESSPFKNARARLALQDESNLHAIFANSQKNPIQGWFPIFNNPQTLDHLSRLLPVFTTRSSSSTLINRGGDFATSLPIDGRELIHLAPGLAERAFGQPILTLTYTLNGRQSIYTSNRLPYGRGYKLQFEDPYRANYLIDVQEENLVTTRREGEWVCLEDLRFTIHRATRREDSPFNKYRTRFEVPEGLSEEGYCYIGQKTLNEAERNFFETVFGTSNPNNLPFEIGETVVIRQSESIIIDQPCIKFKRPGCYPGQGFYRIEFDPGKLSNCVLNEQIANRHHLNDEFYRICPAFLSVCYRTN